MIQMNKPMSDIDRLVYEARQRIKWFIDGYFQHNLGIIFSRLTTQEICWKYNVSMSYFRPWLNIK